MHYGFHNLIENENSLSHNDVLIIIGLVVGGLLLLTALGITVFCGVKKYMRYRRSKNYIQPYLYQLTISYLIDNCAQEPNIREIEPIEEIGNNNDEEIGNNDDEEIGNNNDAEIGNNNDDDVLPHVPIQAESSACNIIFMYAKSL